MVSIAARFQVIGLNIRLFQCSDLILFSVHDGDDRNGLGFLRNDIVNEKSFYKEFTDTFAMPRFFFCEWMAVWHRGQL